MQNLDGKQKTVRKITSIHRSTVPGQRPSAFIRDLGRVVSYLVINPRIPGYKTGDRPGSLDRIKRTAAVVGGHLFESMYTTAKVLTL